METNFKEKIDERLESMSVDDQAKVWNFVESLTPQKRTPWQLWQEHLKEIPEDEWKDVPADASLNVDHYLYGTPKK